MENIEDLPLGVKIEILKKVFRNAVKEECEKEGINITYGHILMMLSEHKEGVCQNDIVNNVRLKAPTISLTLKTMESLNLITRKPSPVDKRNTIVEITKEGILYDEKIKRCFAIVEKTMIKNLSNEEISTIDKYIDILKNNILERNNND